MLPSLTQIIFSNELMACLIYSLNSFLILYFLFKTDLLIARAINYFFLTLFTIILFIKSKNSFINEKILFYLSLIILTLFLITKSFLLLRKTFFYTTEIIHNRKNFIFFRKKTKKNSPLFKNKKSSPFGSPQVLTSFGLKVRSKSEVFIAEKLKEKNILFTYEKPLSAEGKTYYPDFTVHIGKKEYYWEHFGMMNDEVYAKRTAIKIKWYNKNFPKKLIWTEENSHLMIQIQEIVEKIAKTKQLPQSYPRSQNHGIKARASQNHHI